MHGVAAIALLTACGRIGFDARGGDGGAATADAGQYVLSVTQLAASTTCCSFVDLDVDWARQLAYVGTREAGQCFAVIDFSATPTILARRGPPATSGATCLGVAIDALDSTRLLVASEGGNAVELWDLGADPHAGA